MRLERLILVPLLALLMAIPATSNAHADPLDGVWNLVPGCDSSPGRPSVGIDPVTLVRSISVSGGAGCDHRHIFAWAKVCLEAGVAAVRCAIEPNDGTNSASATVWFPCIPGLYRGVATGAAAPGPVPVRHSSLVLITPNDCISARP